MHCYASKIRLARYTKCIFVFDVWSNLKLTFALKVRNFAYGKLCFEMHEQTSVSSQTDIWT